MLALLYVCYYLSSPFRYTSSRSTSFFPGIEKEKKLNDSKAGSKGKLCFPLSLFFPDLHIAFVFCVLISLSIANRLLILSCKFWGMPGFNFFPHLIAPCVVVIVRFFKVIVLVNTSAFINYKFSTLIFFLLLLLLLLLYRCSCVCVCFDMAIRNHDKLAAQAIKSYLNCSIVLEFRSRCIHLVQHANARIPWYVW